MIIGRFLNLCFIGAALALFNVHPLSLFAQGTAGASKKTSVESRGESKTHETGAPSDNSSTGGPSQGLRATISDFAWLEGKWQGAWGPRLTEEIWTAPRAGQMLGLFRVVENDKTLVIELFSLLETPTGLELRFRHFTPALVPWEQSGAALMKLVDADTKTAIFENPSDGQPKRDVFTRVDPDTYMFRSEIVPVPAGTSHVTEIRYHRQK